MSQGRRGTRVLFCAVLCCAVGEACYVRISHLFSTLLSIPSTPFLSRRHVNMLHVGAFHRIAAIQAELRAAVRAGKDRKGLLAAC